MIYDRRYIIKLCYNGVTPNTHTHATYTHALVRRAHTYKHSQTRAHSRTHTHTHTIITKLKTYRVLSSYKKGYLGSVSRNKIHYYTFYPD